MYYVYVLLNWNKKHWYIGSTQNFESRLKHHNDGYTFSTKPYRPWKIVHLEKFDSRKEAFKREMFLKSPSGYKEYLSIKDKILNGGVA
ncbi:MAG TPA: GIY-YIG nuclease family protein [Candidatus Woesebacteria bacterium]|nr:GIY-YIG nuclease family protein [Candidatus Woesebacteria bacterium]